MRMDDTRSVHERPTSRMCSRCGAAVPLHATCCPHCSGPLVQVPAAETNPRPVSQERGTIPGDKGRVR